MQSVTVTSQTIVYCTLAWWMMTKTEKQRGISQDTAVKWTRLQLTLRGVDYEPSQGADLLPHGQQKNGHFWLARGL